MNSLCRSISLSLLSSVAFFHLSQSTLAALTNLETPSVAFDSGYSKTERDQVLKVLKSDKCKFVRGTTLNSFTTLQYRGNTESLNSLLDQLASCRQLNIHISFAHPKNGDVLSESDWCIHHEAHNNSFHFRVNLESKQIDLQRLYIPDIHSRKELTESGRSEVSK